MCRIIELLAKLFCLQEWHSRYNKAYNAYKKGCTSAMDDVNSEGSLSIDDNHNDDRRDMDYEEEEDDDEQVRFVFFLCP